MESILFAVGVGFLLDLRFGDPAFLAHPIRFIGALISNGEALLKKIPMTSPRGQFAAGTLLATCVVAISFLVPYALLTIAGYIHPAFRFVLEAFFCYQIFAMKSLKMASMDVYAPLVQGDIGLAREKLSYIVGRDTQNLSEEQIVKATVETVAENTADGVIAPMIFMMLGGAPLGFLYKAINTLDSMIGYNNEQYQYFGKFAARLDDVANYIPARLSAFFMIVGALFCKYDVKKAIGIFLRDRYNHKSPNSAQTESVCAGALGIQLGGTNSYFGKVVVKQTIGDATRAPISGDIVSAIKLMLATSMIGLVILGAFRVALHLF